MRKYLNWLLGPSQAERDAKREAEHQARCDRRDKLARDLREQTLLALDRAATVKRLREAEEKRQRDKRNAELAEPIYWPGTVYDTSRPASGLSPVSPPAPYHDPAYNWYADQQRVVGRGGSFDGAGASGDYDRSPGLCDQSQISSASDSSPSSSDSGSSSCSSD